MAIDVGSAIQFVRKKRKLSQASLADKAEMSISYLSLLERNRRDPPLSTLMRLAKALALPIEMLMFLAAGRNRTGELSRELAGQIAIEVINALN